MHLFSRTFKLSPMGQEKLGHRLFQIGVISKGIGGLSDVLLGIVAVAVPKIALQHTILSVFHNALVRDPDFVLANVLYESLRGISMRTQHFIAFYLFSHGIIKIFLVTQLLRGKLWAFPVSATFMSILICYQLFRFTQTHSLVLLFFTFLDIAVVALIVYEQQRMTGERVGNRTNEAHM
ncbi:MAG: DUF2127 domain-containing protein [Candidatus Peribacteraceae bacterium]